MNAALRPNPCFIRVNPWLNTIFGSDNMPRRVAPQGMKIEDEEEEEEEEDEDDFLVRNCRVSRTLARKRDYAYKSAMQVPLVMTVIGHDRPGIVEQVARLVAEHGGNWLESRMCRLGGEFAGILRVHVPDQEQEALAGALGALSAQGLIVVAQPDTAETPAPPKAMAILEIVGQDRPGIVRQISHALAAQRVNVEELETECGSAPMSGETIFKALARLQLLEGCDVQALRQELERIASDLLVEISFVEMKSQREAKPRQVPHQGPDQKMSRE
jgi:glycine cleavage system regulatory protein